MRQLMGVLGWIENLRPIKDRLGHKSMFYALRSYIGSS